MSVYFTQAAIYASQVYLSLHVLDWLYIKILSTYYMSGFIKAAYSTAIYIIPTISAYSPNTQSALHNRKVTFYLYTTAFANLLWQLLLIRSLRFSKSIFFQKVWLSTIFYDLFTYRHHFNNNYNNEHLFPLIWKLFLCIRITGILQSHNYTGKYFRYT